MGFLDKGLVPGQTYRYRIFATTRSATRSRSDTVTVVVATDGAIDAYAQDVIDDRPTSYWRLGEASGDAVVDWIGFNDATAGSGVTRGTAGAIIGDSNTRRPSTAPATASPSRQRRDRPEHLHRRGLVQDHDDQRRQDRRLRQQPAPAPAAATTGTST